MYSTEQNKFSLKARARSFGFAFNGLRILIKDEHNARVHFVTAVVAIVAGFAFKISTVEWMAIIFAIGFVLTAEIINSAVESHADHVSPEEHHAVRKVKDLMAAGVLVSAITALIVGLIIFLPKIF